MNWWLSILLKGFNMTRIAPLVEDMDMMVNPELDKKEDDAKEEDDIECVQLVEIGVKRW